MEETEFNTQFRKVKATELAVKQSIARFNSRTVSDAALDSYKTSLQNIKKKLEAFEVNVNDILIDLEDDDPRKDDLEARCVELSNEVKINEDEINDKMKVIKESQPSFLADQENLALLKKKLLDANTKEEEAKVKSDKILQLDIETLNSRITKLTTTLAAVKKAKLLDDNKVRHTLSNLSKWELAIEKIEESKDKIDRDSVKATVDDAEVEKIKSAFDKLNKVFEA